ncbi:MAG: DUF2789 domain-containing protein [Methylococcaceae bacterium]|nr:DUF2789 domain-containing protein [Methylococcaceae bacterium]MCI0668701.1 DUF2789 domain-containing protein [Methylococcaceae bacterium]MCI0733350.1 DUF2789 domain-containing protein [Methylococcaceae bacterium]
MDTSSHDIHALFLQLGLTNRSEDIDAFVERHQRLEPGIPLDQAPFWTEAQSTFLREAISEDSDWCEAVDELDTRLRR